VLSRFCELASHRRKADDEKEAARGSPHGTRQDFGRGSHERALQQQQQGTSTLLGELLLQLGLVSKEDLLEALTEMSRVEYTECSRLQPSQDTLLLVPAPLVRKFRALPQIPPLFFVISPAICASALGV